jgi:hypothetical protein
MTVTHLLFGLVAERSDCPGGLQRFPSTWDWAWFTQFGHSRPSALVLLLLALPLI